MAVMTYNALDLPGDIWWRIMGKCGPDELIALEKCCRLFQNIVKSRSIWLRCLQNLGPSEPPNLPTHVSPDSLSISELRMITAGARRCAINRESDSSPVVVRETVLPLQDANPDEVLGEPIEFGLHLYLLPGGAFLVILWPAGYLQCWSVQDKTCLWVYPDLPEGASEDRPKLLWGFDVDMQPNGDVHFLLIDEYLQGNEMGDRYPIVVRFSPGSTTLKKLHSGRLLNKEYGLPVIVKLRGNLTVIYQQVWGTTFGALTVFFREEDKALMITDIDVDCLEIVDEFILCVINVADGEKSFIMLRLADILQTARSTAEPQKVTSLVDILLCAVLLQPKTFSLRTPQLTVNSLHWKHKLDQNKIYITILYKDEISRGNPFARIVLDKTIQDSSNSNILHLETLSYDIDEDNASITLSSRTFVSYTTLTPPTLSGQSLVLLHSNDVPAENQDELALATLSPEGRMRFKPLDLGFEYDKMHALCTEFYSGAVVFATEKYDSVIIKYFE